MHAGMYVGLYVGLYAMYLCKHVYSYVQVCRYVNVGIQSHGFM